MRPFYLGCLVLRAYQLLLSQTKLNGDRDHWHRFHANPLNERLFLKNVCTKTAYDSGRLLLCLLLAVCDRFNPCSRSPMNCCQFTIWLHHGVCKRMSVNGSGQQSI